MCGIIGIASNKSVSINIINSLKKLEYRGYDSAGIALYDGNNVKVTKTKGKVDELESKRNAPAPGVTGLCNVSPVGTSNAPVEFTIIVPVLGVSVSVV